VAIKYPNTPNDVTKRKHYELIQNFSLFIPDESMGNNFEKLLDKYPITPYLYNRESFIKWTLFIHNKINNQLNKEELPFQKFYEKYYEQYKSTDIKTKTESFVDKYIWPINPYKIISCLIPLASVILFKLYY
jgi:hypothetical protein